METQTPLPRSFVNQDHQKPKPALELLSAGCALKPVVSTIARIAKSDAPVLIVGESGTGKELVAQAIHEMSHRDDGPFVCLNLAAVPTELAETILFGHEKGAFTGASHASPGYCRKADGGTLFLDEFGEADLALQAKLLRFLQSGEIQPVGAAFVVKVDVRIVAATNRDLDQAVRDKQFREDLFYRVNVLQIMLPPLRARQEDIDQLVDFFLHEFNLKYGQHCEIADAVRDRLRVAQWPGNVRQLRSGIENLVVLAEHEIIGISDLTSEFLTRIGTRSIDKVHETASENVPELDRLTHQLVEEILNQEQGHVAAAAKRLGISRSTLYRWLKKYRQNPITPAIRDFKGSLDDTVEIA